MRINPVTGQAIPVLKPRQFGSETFPLRQSDLSKLAGPFACPRAFFLGIREYNEGVRLKTWSWPKTSRGTVLHAAIEEIHHNNSWSKAPFVYMRAWQREERNPDNPPINWRYDDRRKIIREGWAMLKGYVTDPRNREATVLAQEVTFTVRIGGRYWATGTIDQVRKIDGGIALVDFKSGAIPVDDMAWDYQLSIYALALANGTLFYKSDPARTFSFSEYPTAIYVVKLGDYVPYERLVAKTIGNAAEAEFYGARIGSVIQPLTDKNPAGHPLLTKGKARGPAFYEANIDRDLLPLQEKAICNAVATIRMNRYWFANSSFACSKCSYKGPVCRDLVSESGNDLCDLSFTSTKKGRAHAVRSSYRPATADRTVDVQP